MSEARFAKSHEWVLVDGPSATIGISDFAVKSLTDLVYLELPKPGKFLKPGDTFGVVESVKSASDLYSPIAGTVREVNTPLSQDLGALSDDPYGTGWLLKLDIEGDPGTVLEGLMDRAAYDAFCASESH
jgi:glycine cleavage system H protein